jgi:hypothetical protein
MAKVRFVGVEETCEVDGVTFHRNQWNGNHGLADWRVAGLATNPTFEVKGCDATDPEPELADEPLGPVFEG